jgi:hypothetical protein
MTPNPGSDEAIEQGCTCPIIDNNHGAGIGKDEKGETLFWYSLDCPLHGHLLTDEVEK